jgi:hypothetical protein
MKWKENLKASIDFKNVNSNGENVVIGTIDSLDFSFDFKIVKIELKKVQS